MKTTIQKVCVMLLALVTLCAVSGCSTATGGGGYRLKQTRDDMDWAMTRYKNRVAAGFVTPAGQQQVAAAYKAYQAAFDAAVGQAQSNYDAPTPDNVKQLADQLLNVLAATQ